MSEKDRLIQARKLMRAGEINQAKAILTGMEHPKAKEWLSLLPEKSPTAISRNTKMMTGTGLVGLLILVAVLGYLGGRERIKYEIAAIFAGAFAPNPAADATSDALDIMFAQTMTAIYNTPVPANTAVPTDTPVPVAGGKWRVQVDKSAFDDTTTVTLILSAENSIEGWIGDETPTLVLRCKERELDAYVNLKMQANVELDDEFDNSPTVRLRFDNETAYTERTIESTDGEALFFKDAASVILKMEHTDTLLYGFTPFNSSPVQTSFDLRELKAIDAPLWDAC